jgi:hypothetical protein
LSRAKKGLAAAFVAALMTVATAAPAFAFVHENVPADECSDNLTAGNQFTAATNIIAHNPVQTLPLGQPDTADVPEACLEE